MYYLLNSQQRNFIRISPRTSKGKLLSPWLLLVAFQSSGLVVLAFHPHVFFQGHMIAARDLNISSNWEHKGGTSASVNDCWVNLLPMSTTLR